MPGIGGAARAAQNHCQNQTSLINSEWEMWFSARLTALSSWYSLPAEKPLSKANVFSEGWTMSLELERKEETGPASLWNQTRDQNPWLSWDITQAGYIFSWWYYNLSGCHIPALRIRLAHLLGLRSITAQWVTCEVRLTSASEVHFPQGQPERPHTPRSMNSGCLHHPSKHGDPTPWHGIFILLKFKGAPNGLHLKKGLSIWQQALFFPTLLL